MSNLIRFWRNGYYTDLFLAIILFIAFFISISKKKKHPQFKFIPFYFSTFILLTLYLNIKIFFFSDTPYSKKLSTIGTFIDGFVTFTEFFAFMYLFYFIIKNNKKRNLIKGLSMAGLITFTLIILKNMFFDGTLQYQSLTTIYILESAILLIPCFYYYYELFSFPPKLNLLHDANFWTVTGLTFYLICTLPLSFVLAYYYKTNYLIYASIFNIINLFYIILFVMIIKSYLCKGASLI